MLKIILQLLLIILIFSCQKQQVPSVVTIKVPEIANDVWMTMSEIVDTAIYIPLEPTSISDSGFRCNSLPNRNNKIYTNPEIPTDHFSYQSKTLRCSDAWSIIKENFIVLYLQEGCIFLTGMVDSKN